MNNVFALLAIGVTYIISMGVGKRGVLGVQTPPPHQN